MTLEGIANASRSNGSSLGYGSLGRGSCHHMTRQQAASNHQIIKQMAQAQRNSDWVKYHQLQNLLSY